MIKKISTSCSSDAYSDGDVINGILKIDYVCRSGRMPILHSVMVQDGSTACPNIDLVLLDANLSSATTTLTDNAICQIADSDLTHILGVVQITTFVKFDDNSVGFAGSLGIPVAAEDPAADPHLYVIPVARGTSPVDWTSLSFTFNFVE